MMLSNEVQNHLRKSILKFTSTRIYPIIYNQIENRVYVEEGLVRMLPVFLHFGITVIFTLPVTILGPGILVRNSDQISEIAMPAVALICYYYVLFSQITFYIHRHEVCIFINKFLQFEQSHGKSIIK